jgi:ribosome-associated toxin RatA of RatAB toxin-antitoxin module
MTSRVLKATVPAPAATVVELLADEAEFPAYAPDLIAVADAGAGAREWVLAFRGGAATWTQATRRSDDVPHRIEFAQLRGDFQHLVGSWTCTDRPDGCEVAFEVDFGTSVPHLAGAIDSAVGRVLIGVAYQVLAAVGGSVHVTAGGHHLSDLDQQRPGAKPA